MKKFGKIMLIALGFGLVTVALGFLTSNPAPAQLPPPTVPVKVTNTPLPVQGAVNANVTNTPLPVQGTVTANISSLPNVNATITNSSFLIGNPAANPVPVSNVNDSVDREFSGFLCEADYFSPPDCFGNLTVDPAGFEQMVNSYTAPTTTPSGLKVTQAVIEYVSGVCRADTTDDIVEVGISGLPSIGISPEAPVRTPGTPREVAQVPGQNSPTTWSWSHTAKIYLPPGTNISLFVRSTGPPNQSNAERCYLNFWGTLLTQ